MGNVRRIRASLAFLTSARVFSLCVTRSSLRRSNCAWIASRSRTASETRSSIPFSYRARRSCSTPSRSSAFWCASCTSSTLPRGESKLSILRALLSELYPRTCSSYCARSWGSLGGRPRGRPVPAFCPKAMAGTRRAARRFGGSHVPCTHHGDQGRFEARA